MGLKLKLKKSTLLSETTTQRKRTRDRYIDGIKQRGRDEEMDETESERQIHKII